MAQDNKFLMFLHIPKTAGNTMLDVFAQNYMFKRITTYYPDLGTTPEQWYGNNLTDLYKSDVLFGHFAYGIHEPFPSNREVAYCTMLREPVSRTISYYHFARKHPVHYLHNEVIKMSLSDFVSSGICSEIDNGQVRILAGWNSMNAAKCSEQDFSLALEHLNAMAVVGVQEKFEESVLLLKKKLGWSSCFYTSKNVGGKKKNSIDEAVLEQIRELNCYDVKLYNAANDRLLKDISVYIDFEKSLREFRISNGTVGKFGKLAWDICVKLAVRGDGK